MMVASLLLSLAAAGAAGAAGALSGRVTGAGGEHLEGVRIEVVEVHRSTVSAPDGQYRIPNLPSGTYSVTFALVGYAPVSRRVRIGEDDVTLDVVLAATAVEIPSIQVTASPIATSALTSPQPMSVLGEEALRTERRASLGETLENQVGVRNLSTGSGVGKPVIRGLTSNRVLVLADGQRLESQQWGDEHGPNVETADAVRVEVIRGPASVMYGSDALGGVINVVQRPLPDASGQPAFARWHATAGFASNGSEPDGSLAVEGANGGFGWRGTLSGRTSSDQRTPAGRLPNTGADSYSGSGAVGVRGGWGAFTAQYAYRNERIEFFEDPEEDPDFSGFQRIDDHRVRAGLSVPVGGLRLEIDAGWERNRRREFEESGAAEVGLGLLSQTATLDGHLHHAFGERLGGIVGLSGLRTTVDKFGEETLVPASDLYAVGVYGFEQLELDRWLLSAGLRFDYRTLDVADDADLGVSAQTRSWTSMTGNIGALYKLSPTTALVLNSGRAFRAPSSFELFANGVHEGTARFERGNAGLGNETAFNTDLAFRIQTGQLRAEAGGFVNLINGYIYPNPTNTFDPVSGFEIFDIVQGDARFTGFEVSAELHPTEWVHLSWGADLVHGQNTTADAPVAFVPPFRTTYGARFEGRDRGSIQAPYLSLQGETNARQTRPAPDDFVPPGYTLAHLGAGFAAAVGGRSLQVDLSIRNVLDTEYTGFLNRYKRFAVNPGRNITVRISSGF